MIAELIGAKLLSPYFGSSLYVWSSVMAITLGGLALGYFTGGRLSTKEKPSATLFFILALSGFSLLLMPYLSQLIFPISYQLPLLPSVIICTVSTLFFPVFLMGTVSPLIIKILTKEASDSGKRAGEVYAISTVGGIISTFLTGFWLIPIYGLIYPLVFSGILILFISLLYLLISKKIFSSAVLLIFSFAFVSLAFSKNKGDKFTVYKSEGILGRVEVIEIPIDTLNSKTTERSLLINNIIQTSLNINTGESTIDYVEVLDKNLNKLSQKNKKALILGLGGGAIANLLIQKGWEVTAVEIDDRIVDVAKKYFSLSPKVKLIIDDARHGLQFAGTDYDLVLFDMYSAEVAPSHVVSVEAFKELEKICKPEATFIFNTYGYLDKAAGLGNLSLLKTLSHLKYENKICFHGNEKFADYRGFLIFSSKSFINAEQTFYNEFFQKENAEIGTLIKDDVPILEYQNSLAARKWRFAYIQNFISRR